MVGSCKCDNYKKEVLRFKLYHNQTLTIITVLRRKKGFSNMATAKESGRNYSQFACIGSGFSAIALGATLKRWYGITDIRFFERHSELGGTWLTNTYPGMAQRLRDMPRMNS